MILDVNPAWLEIYPELGALAGLDENATYKMWMNAIRERLPNVSYPQTPSLGAAVYQRKWRLLAE